MEYKSRNDVPEKYKWDLTDLFKDEKEFIKKYNEAKNQVKDLKKYVGCTKNANLLYEYLKNSMNIVALVERLYIYAYLINDIELGISKHLDWKNKTSDLFALYSVNTSFFEPELLKLKKQDYEILFKSTPLLDEYRCSLDNIYRNKDHILKEREENIITELDNAMNNFSDMSSTMINSEHNYGTAVIDQKEIIISNNNLGKLLKIEDRSIRKDVRDKFYSTLKKYSVSSAQFLNGFVKGNIATSKLHNFKDAWDEKLFSLKLSDKAFNTLIKVTENHVDSLQRYFQIYQKYFGFDKLYPYDTGLELSKIKKEYSIEKAQELCLKAIEPLGTDYKNHFKKIFDNHYIDYAQYPSKYSGAYSFAPLDRDSRILMNYNYDLDSISTVIHESGHNVHDQYVKENNPLQYRSVPTFISEVPSLVNECLLSSFLAINGNNKGEKIAGIANIIDVFMANFFGAVREGKMELDFYNYVNEGNSITQDYMINLDRTSLKKYYGDIIKFDDWSGLSWIRRSHYYMNYYLFNYAFCIVVASNIALEISNGNEKMLDKYLKFLKTGSDVDIIDAFKIINIDLEDEKIYENAIKYFDEKVNQLEQLL